MTNKILFFAGSTRTGSYNKKLAKAAYNIAVEHNIPATFIDLKDYDMPLYNGDDEAENGLPENAIALKDLFYEHNALFIASPEYNSSFSPLLKNTLDWISRPHKENETSLSAFQGKVVALTAASPGALGGLRGLVPLRMMLGNIATLVIPQQLALSNAHDAFSEDGTLADSNQKKRLLDVVEALARVAEKHSA